MKKKILFSIVALIIFRFVVLSFAPSPERTVKESAPVAETKTSTPKPSQSSIYAINTKARDCRPIMASSYEAFRTGYEANMANNNEMLLRMIQKNAIQTISNESNGQEVTVLETKEIVFGSLARLDNKSDVDELWVDLRCLVKK
jgi:hypothetical protein